MKVNRIHKLFPTLLLEVPNFLSDEECAEALTIIEHNKHWLDKNKALTKGMSSHSLQCFLSETKQTLLKEKILDAAELYAKHGGYEIKKIMDNSWFNIEDKESSVVKHSHPLSTLSAALYLKTDEKSSQLQVFNPNSYVLQNTMNTWSTEYGYEWVKFIPATKTLYVFPSWLLHATDVNQTIERTVISCNII